MTTSPLTNTEIEQTFGDEAHVPAPATLMEEWRRFGAFLKRPRLPDGGVTAKGAVQATLRMLWLDLPVMGLLIGTLSLAAALGFEIPNNINTQLAPTLGTIALVVLLAPLLEEIAFRSWLAGHPAILGGAFIGAVGFLIYAFGSPGAQGDPGLTPMMLAGLAVMLVGIPVAAVLLLKKPVPEFFRMAFPVLFWLSTAAFAAIHLLNYTEGSLPILLPLLLPQFVLGAMLGYLRVHHGLIAAIALHAAHNAILFGLAILGGLGEETQAFLLG